MQLTIHKKIVQEEKIMYILQNNNQWKKITLKTWRTDNSAFIRYNLNSTHLIQGQKRFFTKMKKMWWRSYIEYCGCV